MSMYIHIFFCIILFPWWQQTVTHQMCDQICKNQSKLHRNWNPFYCWILKLNSCTNQKRLTHWYRWPSLLSQTAFAIPVRPLRCTTGPLGPVNGINKDVSGTRLLAYDCLDLSHGFSLQSVSVTYWRHSTAACVLVEGITHLRLPTCPHHPSHPPPTCPPPITCHQWYYSRCEKSCSKPSSIS